MATWNDALAVWNDPLYQWDDVQFRPFAVASSSSSGVVTPRWRTPSSPSSSSSVSVKSTPEPTVSGLSSSSGSVTSRPVQKPSSVISSFSSGSLGLITQRAVDKPFSICASSSSSTSSNHIETQFRPSVIAASASVSVTPTRDLYQPSVIASSSSSSGAKCTLQNRPGFASISSSVAVATARYYLEPFPSIASTSIGSSTSRNAFNSIPTSLSSSSVSEILVVNAQTLPSSASSSNTSSKQQFRSLPTCLETAVASASARFSYRISISTASASIASTVVRLAFIPLPNAASASSGIAHTEGAIIRPLARAETLSLATSRVTPAITALMSETSSEAVVVRPLSRTVPTGSSISNAAINLPSEISVTVASSSSATQADRSVRRINTVISSVSTSADKVEPVKRAISSMTTSSSESIVNRNLNRPLVAATSSSSSNWVYQVGPSVHPGSGCISITETDLYPAICSFMPAFASGSVIVYLARIGFPNSVASSSSSAVIALLAARPMPAAVSASNLNTVTESNLPLLTFSNSSMSLFTVLVTPATSTSSSSEVCSLKKCLNPAPIIESDCSANVYTGIVYPVTSISNSTVSDAPRNISQPGSIVLGGSEVDLIQKSLEVPAISQLGLSSSIAVYHLQTELVASVLSSSSSAVVARKGANFIPSPSPQSSSTCSIIASVVIPVTARSLSSCFTVSREREILLSSSSASGSIISRTVAQPVSGLISASTCLFIAEYVIRTQALASSSSASFVQEETIFGSAPQCRTSSSGVLESEDAYEIEVSSQSVSVCNVNASLVNQYQPRMSSSAQCTTPNPINAQTEIVIQSESYSESSISELGDIVEIMAQGECDSMVLINIEYTAASITEMMAEVNSISETDLVLRSLVTFAGASINSASNRVITIPSVSNDQEVAFTV